MRRRDFIAAAGALGLAGCSKVERQLVDQRTPTESAWPTEEAGSTVEPARRNGSGGHRDAEELTSTIVTDAGNRVEIGFVQAAPRVGVTTAETDGNSEQIPSSEFDWYAAPDGSWLWFVGVNLIDRGEDAELPPADRWRAQPVLEDKYDATPKLSLTATYDPDPTFVRKPLWYGGESTLAAYGHEHDRSELSYLVFEVPSTSMDLLYGEPVQVSFGFEIRS